MRVDVIPASPPPPPRSLYELYAVLVHSGSASFGHYYALIKDLSEGDWHEFNDVSVSPIKPAELSRAHGGASGSSSAYLLLYRAKGAPGGGAGDGDVEGSVVGGGGTTAGSSSSSSSSRSRSSSSSSPLAGGRDSVELAGCEQATKRLRLELDLDAAPADADELMAKERGSAADNPYGYYGF